MLVKSHTVNIINSTLTRIIQYKIFNKYYMGALNNEQTTIRISCKWNAAKVLKVSKLST